MKSIIELANQVCDRHLAPPEVEAPATAADILRRAAYRVGQPGAWTQHYLGRTEDGTGTFALRDGVVLASRCMLGALYFEHDLAPEAGINHAYRALQAATGTSLLTQWNDAPERTQDQVVAALIKASEIAEGV